MKNRTKKRPEERACLKTRPGTSNLFYMAVGAGFAVWGLTRLTLRQEDATPEDTAARVMMTTLGVTIVLIVSAFIWANLKRKKR